jgi:hypothetical protein
MLTDELEEPPAVATGSGDVVRCALSKRACGRDSVREHPDRVIGDAHHALVLRLVLLGRHDEGASSMPDSVYRGMTPRLTHSSRLPVMMRRTFPR